MPMVFFSGLTHALYRVCTCRCYECGCTCCDDEGLSIARGGRVGESSYAYHLSDGDGDANAGGRKADVWKRRWLSFWSRIGEAIGELGPNQESDAAFVVLLQVYAGADEKLQSQLAAPQLGGGRSLLASASAAASQAAARRSASHDVRVSGSQLLSLDTASAAASSSKRSADSLKIRRPGSVRSGIVDDLEKLFTSSPEHFNFYFPQLCNYVLRRLLAAENVPDRRATKIELEDDDEDSSKASNLEKRKLKKQAGRSSSPSLALVGNKSAEPLTLPVGSLDHFLLVRCATSKYLAHRLFWFIESFLRTNRISKEMAERIDSIIATVRASGSAVDRWTGIDPDLWDQLLWTRAEERGKGRAASDPSDNKDDAASMPRRTSSSQPLLQKKVDVRIKSPPEDAKPEQQSTNPALPAVYQKPDLGAPFAQQLAEEECEPKEDQEQQGTYETKSLSGDAATRTSKSLKRTYDTEWSSALAATPILFEELVHLADEISRELPAKRNRLLRSALSSRIFANRGPSSSLYLPVGVDVGGLPDRAFPRIVGVIADESFCFKTASRAPMFLCFEVVDVTPDKRGLHRKRSSLLNWPSSSPNTALKKASRWGRKRLAKMKDSMDEIGTRVAQHFRSKSALASTDSSRKLLSDDGEGVGASTPAKEKKHSSDMLRTPPEIAGFVSENEEDTDAEDEGEGKEPAEERLLGQWTPKSPEMVSGRKALKRPHTAHVLSKTVSRSQKSVDVPKLRLTPVDENAQADQTRGVERVATAVAISADWDDMPSETEGSAAEEDAADKRTSDEAVVVFREKWAEKEKRLRSASPYGSCKGWRLVPVIVKANDDLRQEQFAFQLIAQFQRIYKQAHGKLLWLRPYSILATSAEAGLIEAVPDTISLDALKKNDPGYTNLNAFFERYYGKGSALRRAKKRFCKSLASYCVLCYLLQVKDRHNGNILLDAKGHIIHIDFGFFLTASPGGNWNFESAPFKLTNEFVEVLGGADSRLFQRFRRLCVLAYLAARKSREQIILLAEMMLSGNEDLACFQAGGRVAIEALRSRFNPKMSSRQCEEFVNSLINTSINHWSTRWYDKYQRCCVGIW